jgi:hypothetical protein
MKDKHKTEVKFRKFPEGDVIALFPKLRFDWEGSQITSYMHMGQHGGASPDLIKELDKAKPKEYNDLKRELESIGYNLKVTK